jgi:hypothetical protein
MLSVVPLAALTVVLGVLAAAILTDPPLDFPFSEPPPGAPIPSVDLALGDLTLSGRVVGPDDAPVDGAGVSLKERDRPVWTWSSSDGAFALPELDAGPKRVLVTALGLQATAFDIELGPEGADPVVLKLEREIVPPEVPEGLALQDLRGKIDLGPLAGPEGGFEVLFQPLLSPSELGGGFPRRVAVDREGRFEAPLLQQGGYRVILLAPDDRGASGPDLLSTGAKDVITIQHGADGETGELELASKAGLLQGTVTAPATGADEADRPVRGALVRAEPLSVDPDETRRGTLVLGADDFRATRTDPAGRFVLRHLRPGRYRVTVVAGRARRQSDIIVPEGTAVDVPFDKTR